MRAQKIPKSNLSWAFFGQRRFWFVFSVWEISARRNWEKFRRFGSWKRPWPHLFLLWRISLESLFPMSTKTHWILQISVLSSQPWNKYLKFHWQSVAQGTSFQLFDIIILFGKNDIKSLTCHSTKTFEKQFSIRIGYLQQQQKIIPSKEGI